MPIRPFSPAERSSAPPSPVRVIGKPELLLADEPTGNVDPQMARRLLRLFIELNRLGTSVLIATHDHQLMRQFKAPRLELHDGHVRIV